MVHYKQCIMLLQAIGLNISQGSTIDNFIKSIQGPVSGKMIKKDNFLYFDNELLQNYYKITTENYYKM